MLVPIDSLVLATTLLASVSWAHPLAKRTFTVEQVPSGRMKAAGRQSLNHAYRKYGKKTLAEPKARKGQKKLNGQVAANPTTGDEEYIVIVIIGGQEVCLDLDTGSSDLWVYSSFLPAASIGNHSVIDPKNSKTAKEMQGASWSIAYGDKSWAKGKVYTDTVAVGIAVASTQAVELATEVSPEFLSDYGNDGLLGLGFDSGNTVSPNPQKTFFSNVKKSLDAPLFTVDLKAGAPGSYDFGFIDKSKYAGDIVYMDVDNSQGYWGVSSSSYGVGGDGSSLKTKKIDTIIDTGSTLILLPGDVLTDYYGQVKGATNDPTNGWGFPCDATLPDFYIGFTNYTAKVPASTINFSSSGDTCFGGLQSIGSGDGTGPSAIYGDIFLKSSFVVFEHTDGKKPTLGFAAKAGQTPITPATPAAGSSSPDSSSPDSSDPDSDSPDSEDSEPTDPDTDSPDSSDSSDSSDSDSSDSSSTSSTSSAAFGLTSIIETIFGFAKPNSS